MSFENPKYDPRTLSYNCGQDSTAFRLFNAAVAATRAGGAPTVVHCLGDSTMRGSGVTPANNGALPNLIRNFFTATGKFGIVSDGIGLLGQTSDGRVAQTGWANNPPLGSSGGFGAGGNLYAGPTQSSATPLVFTPLTPCDSFNIYLGQYPATTGSFTYQIDGGTAVTVTNTAGSQSGYGSRVVTVSAGTRGMHTLTINPTVAASTYVAVLAIEPVDSTATLRIGTLGLSGTTSANWVDTSSGVTNLGSLYCTYDLPVVAPSLSIIDLGTNDYDNSTAKVSLANYTANLTTIINKARSKNGDVLLTGLHPTNFGYDFRRSTYVQALYALCDNLNVGLVDVSRLFPASFATYTAAPYSMSSDTYHPNLKGYEVWGQALATAMSGLI